MAEVTITIDRKRIQAASGSLLIDVCKRAGIEILSFCYYPGLSLQGACHMCLVEIAKTPKLQTACTTVVTNGMGAWAPSRSVPREWPWSPRGVWRLKRSSVWRGGSTGGVDERTWGQPTDQQVRS